MPKEKTSSKVFQYIEEKVIKGIWKPGEKITPELQLSAELGVSRGAVREALEKLVALNVLRRQRGGGTYVNTLTSTNYMDKLSHFLILGKSEYEEIIQFRLAIDTLAVRLFIKYADALLIKELENIHEKMIASKDLPDIFFEYDAEFHKLIASGSKNSILYRTTEMLFNTMKYYSAERYKKVNPDTRILEHGNILNAIKDKDVKLATLFAEKHLKRSIPDLEEL